MSNIINVAQIGCGYWGPNLLRNLVANKRCNLKTIVEISLERRDYVKALYPSIIVTDNIQQALDDESIDALVIATPVTFHYDQSIKALQSGKNILVEKPMATTIEEVDQIGILAEQNNLVAMAGHTFLYNSAVRYVKKLIDGGDLGDIRYIYSQRLNLGRIRSDVDALWNFAPHDVSIIQYWLEDLKPVSISRRGMDYIQNGVDDVAFMNIEYPNRVIANIHVSWLDPHKVRRITVVGSKKMVVYDDIAENKVTLYDKGVDRIATLGKNMDYDNLPSFHFNYRSGDIISPKIDWKEPLKVEIEHFIDCIINGTNCLTGVKHAREVINILSVGNNTM